MTNPFNKIALTGRLTKEPTVRPSANGKSATIYLSVAVRDNFKTNGSYKTQFVSVQKFVSSQEQLNYHTNFAKGDLVAIESSVQVNTSGDKTYTNLVINTIRLITKATPKAEVESEENDSLHFDEDSSEDMQESTSDVSDGELQF
ncbi:single-stranded DNA-binding protein [Kurthia sibirica]|uniref:Single-stranded DNA-binding protein n=1 Tax=Kurthia sibirica TaxID=202750 RepID=A0A2U3AGR3_9BACL|nr:single-stranded DNA-binding protein [Kurthia sibirica]PWI23736.1 hypothetical protein DEX24_15700 [Kurthia sibirica]GEK35713.1 hypothetical protein KSI01_32460 [Kurthia sibirica]